MCLGIAALQPWARGVYDRISGKQITRKKKAAVALARKIAVIAWAMLRDEKDWDPKRMIEVSESYGKMPKAIKDSLLEMKPKENSDQRKSARRKEAREAIAKEPTKPASVSTSPEPKPQPKKTPRKSTTTSRVTNDSITRATAKPTTNSITKPRTSQKASNCGLMHQTSTNESAWLVLLIHPQPPLKPYNLKFTS